MSARHQPTPAHPAAAAQNQHATISALHAPRSPPTMWEAGHDAPLRPITRSLPAPTGRVRSVRLGSGVNAQLDHFPA